MSSTCNSGSNLASCIKNYYNTYGITGTNLYYHNSSLTNGAGDNSYRYAGASDEVNNYVCFGSTASTCPSDNLYRIIGVFGNQVKLIKATSYGRYVWESDFSGQGNAWDASTKPDIRSTLNSTFLGTLSSTWQNKIATHAYKVGGMAQDNSYTAKQYYNTEVGSSSSSTTDNMKVGLMYVSDYGFAASNSHWTTELYNYDNANSDNWLYLGGSSEWTISRCPGFFWGNAFAVSGHVYGNRSVDSTSVVRPVFYLNSSINYVSGSGSSADPIRIS